MTDDSFKIRRGILSRTENAIPYRQIQDADIERSLFFRMLGLSRLVILTAGHEDEAPKGSDEAEGIIPAVDQKLAAVQMIDVHLPTTDGRELVLTRYTQPEPELLLLIGQLRLQLPPQPPPKITTAALAPAT